MKRSVNHRYIANSSALVDFCQRAAESTQIAFDTEFVSEDSYRPELCLVQVAVGEEVAAIDPLAIDDLTPFWSLVTDPQREVIVHAGRQEMMFCFEALNRVPQRLFDVQLAAGLVGIEYPAGYGNLVMRTLGLKAHKAETRTDWRRRPLSAEQIDYALDDVRFLGRIHAKLTSRLESLGRLAWFQDEQKTWLTDLDESRQGERWRRVSGSSGLSSRCLAIVRALWYWREEEAARRNRPVRQVLRDDLIVELAKRRSSDPRQIGAIRGMERGDLRRQVDSMAAAIESALKLPDDLCPQPVRVDTNSHLTLLGQLLSSALGSICRKAEVAASLVGTPSDVRDLIAWRIDSPAAPPPSLARGWRAEVVGNVLDDMLAGKLAIRIEDPRSDHPLTFEPFSTDRD